MKFRHTPVALAVFAALGSVSVTPALAQQTQAQQSQTLERVTITGSNIRRTDQETVAPVEIITREQIERSGQATIADVIKTIPANLGGSYSESFANSFASGASGISLRGLGQKSTLVLLNGRRTSGYGFAQNLQDTFVDFNSIPTAAIERVEILKDGASAIYGSDAIAGVINIILRKDYKGIEAGGSVGFFEGANDYRANLVMGFGDLGSDKFNVFGVFDYYKRDGLLLSDTKHGESRDYRGEDGGRNFESLTARWHLDQRQQPPRYRRVHAARWLRRGLCRCRCKGPDCPRYQHGAEPARKHVVRIRRQQGADRPARAGALRLPRPRHLRLLGHGPGFAEFAYSRVDNYQTFTAPFFAGTTGLQPTPAGLRPFTYNITFGPGVAGNPFGTTPRSAATCGTWATRDQDTSPTRFARWRPQYAFGRWDFESALGWSKNEIDQINLQPAVEGRVPAPHSASRPGPFPPQPVVDEFDHTTWTVGNHAGRGAGMLIDVARTAESELTFIDTRATTEFGSLPGGAIGLAAGVEFRKES
jgi:iron complex outermembrane recepter protein